MDYIGKEVKYKESVLFVIRNSRYILMLFNMGRVNFVVVLVAEKEHMDAEPQKK